MARSFVLSGPSRVGDKVAPKCLSFGDRNNLEPLLCPATSTEVALLEVATVSETIDGRPADGRARTGVGLRSPIRRCAAPLQAKSSPLPKTMTVTVEPQPRDTGPARVDFRAEPKRNEDFEACVRRGTRGRYLRSKDRRAVTVTVANASN